MSHPINDMVKESLYERFHDMTLLQFVAWLETHKDTDDVAQRVYFSLDSLTNKWGENRYSITPKNNMYIAFPGYLKHFVTTNLSKKDRISLSANLNIEKKS